MNIKIEKIKLLFQGVVFASFYLKNSLNLTLKELNEAESLICFGISFQVLAPWYPKDFLRYSSRSRGVLKSSIFLVLYFEIFDLGVNLFLKISGQSPLFILYVGVGLSYLSRLRRFSQSHPQPSLYPAHSISLIAAVNPLTDLLPNLLPGIDSV